MIYPEKTRYVYFARAGDMVKIGCSVQPLERLTQIGEWLPFKISLVATTPGGFSLEAAFHAHFSAEWSHLEWFHFTPRVESMIDDINNGRPFELNYAIKDTPKHIQKCLKKAATNRVTMAENRAGRPGHYPTRRAMRPRYLVEAMYSFHGAHKPPPSESALAAIEMFERELEMERAA